MKDIFDGLILVLCCVFKIGYYPTPHPRETFWEFVLLCKKMAGRYFSAFVVMSSIHR